MESTPLKPPKHSGLGNTPPKIYEANKKMLFSNGTFLFFKTSFLCKAADKLQGCLVRFTEISRFNMDSSQLRSNFLSICQRFNPKVSATWWRHVEYLGVRNDREGGEGVGCPSHKEISEVSQVENVCEVWTKDISGQIRSRPHTTSPPEFREI